MEDHRGETDQQRKVVADGGRDQAGVGRVEVPGEGLVLDIADVIVVGPGRALGKPRGASGREELADRAGIRSDLFQDSSNLRLCCPGNQKLVEVESRRLRFPTHEDHLSNARGFLPDLLHHRFVIRDAPVAGRENPADGLGKSQQVGDFACSVVDGEKDRDEPRLLQREVSDGKLGPIGELQEHPILRLETFGQKIEGQGIHNLS